MDLLNLGGGSLERKKGGIGSCDSTRTPWGQPRIERSVGGQEAGDRFRSTTFYDDRREWLDGVTVVTTGPLDVNRRHLSAVLRELAESLLAQPLPPACRCHETDRTHQDEHAA